MFDSIWRDVRREFSYGNTINRLIIVNVATFLLVNLVKILLLMSNLGDLVGFDQFLKWFALSRTISDNFIKPWVWLTSIFLHENFWHLLWNMLALYWFGRIVGDLLGDRRILPIYLLGGIFGGLAYVIAAQMSYLIGGTAYGASAAVMAMVAAAGFASPDYRMNVLLIGDVKLKYIAGVLILLDIIAIADNVNSGGSVAHLGGAVLGAVYVMQLYKGIEIGKPIMILVKKIENWWTNRNSPPLKKQTNTHQRPQFEFSKNSNPPPKTANRQNTEGGVTPPKTKDKSSFQHRVDEILDKIKQSGYDSLTTEEKEFLFRASKE